MFQTRGIRIDLTLPIMIFTMAAVSFWRVYDADMESVARLHDQCENADVEFDFIGTGNIFIKDGKAYRIPKAYQRVQAQRSGLSYPSGNTEVPMQQKCRFCKRKNSCNGCHWCGKCG